MYLNSFANTFGLLYGQLDVFMRDADRAVADDGRKAQQHSALLFMAPVALLIIMNI